MSEVEYKVVDLQSYFALEHLNREVDVLFEPCMVTIFNSSSEEHKVFEVTLEVDKSRRVLQMRLVCPHSFDKMFANTMDEDVYKEIRAAQSLNVTFLEFISNLTKILLRCKKEEMKMIMAKSDTDYFLQFVEVRSFKNFIHLSLPVKRSSEFCVLLYMKKSLQLSEERLASNELLTLELKDENTQKQKVIDKLQIELSALKIDFEEKQKHNQRSGVEEKRLLQESIQGLVETKQKLIKNYEIQITELQDAIKRLRADNLEISAEKMSHMKENIILRDEICTQRLALAKLNAENENLSKEIQMEAKIHEGCKKEISNMMNQIKGLKNALLELEKARFVMKAEVQAERKLCYSKQTALQLATEQFEEANKIIKIQAKNIAMLKDSINWRNDVAVQQEIVVMSKNAQITFQNKFFQEIRTEIIEFSIYLKDYECVLKELERIVHKIIFRTQHAK